MNEDQIKHMVDRFLGWKLPENFSPDGGISFERFGNKGTPHQYAHQPTGTNLIDAMQADAMVRYMVEGLATLSETKPTQETGHQKRPFAFAVRRAPENGPDEWRLFRNERDAREAAEQLDGDYECLYRVGDRRSAIAALSKTKQP